MMKMTYIPCGADCVDRAAIAPSGEVMAMAAAPRSSLKIFDVSKNRFLSWWRAPRAEDVDQVAVAPLGRTHQVLYHRSKSNQVERYALDRQRLDPIELPDRYQLYAMTVSRDGGSVACGDSFGNLSVYDISSRDPQRSYFRHFLDGGIYALAWSGDDHFLYLSNAHGQILKVDLLTQGSLVPLHRARKQYECFSISAHPEASDAIAFGGDGNRVWLLNLPFSLNPGDDQAAGDGFPVKEWELDMGDFADRWDLKKRVFLPRVDEDKAAWVDTDVGTTISHVHLTRDWHLFVTGDSGMELWNLRPLRLERSEYWRNKISRRIFASNETAGGLQLVREAS